MAFKLWTAKLNNEEKERVTDKICDQMIDDLELAWEQIKLDHLLPKKVIRNGT